MSTKYNASRWWRLNGIIERDYKLHRNCIDLLRWIPTEGSDTELYPGDEMILKTTATLEPSGQMVLCMPHPALYETCFVSVPHTLQPGHTGPVVIALRAFEQIELLALPYVVRLWDGPFVTEPKGE